MNDSFNDSFNAVDLQSPYRKELKWNDNGKDCTINLGNTNRKFATDNKQFAKDIIEFIQEQEDQKYKVYFKPHKGSQSLLHKVIKCKTDIKTLKNAIHCLLRSGVDINHEDEKGVTSLVDFVKSFHGKKEEDFSQFKEVVKLLVVRGAGFEKQDDKEVKKDVYENIVKVVRKFAKKVKEADKETDELLEECYTERKELSNAIKKQLDIQGIKDPVIYGSNISVELGDNAKEFKVSEFLHSALCKEHQITECVTRDANGNGISSFVSRDGTRHYNFFVKDENSKRPSLNVTWYVDGKECKAVLRSDKEGHIELVGDIEADQQLVKQYGEDGLLSKNKEITINGVSLLKAVQNGRNHGRAMHQGQQAHENITSGYQRPQEIIKDMTREVGREVNRENTPVGHNSKRMSSKLARSVTETPTLTHKRRNSNEHPVLRRVPNSNGNVGSRSSDQFSNNIILSLSNQGKIQVQENVADTAPNMQIIHQDKGEANVLSGKSATGANSLSSREGGFVPRESNGTGFTQGGSGDGALLSLEEEGQDKRRDNLMPSRNSKAGSILDPETKVVTSHKILEKNPEMQIDNDQKQGGIKSSELEKGSQKIASDNSLPESEDLLLEFGPALANPKIDKATLAQELQEVFANYNTQRSESTKKAFDSWVKFDDDTRENLGSSNIRGKDSTDSMVMGLEEKESTAVPVDSTSKLALSRSKDDGIQINSDQKQGGIKSAELEKGSQKIASDNSLPESEDLLLEFGPALANPKIDKATLAQELQEVFANYNTQRSESTKKAFDSWVKFDDDTRENLGSSNIRGKDSTDSMVMGLEEKESTAVPVDSTSKLALSRSKDDGIQINSDQKQGGIKSAELEKGSQKIASDNSLPESEDLLLEFGPALANPKIDKATLAQELQEVFANYNTQRSESTKKAFDSWVKFDDDTRENLGSSNIRGKDSTDSMVMGLEEKESTAVPVDGTSKLALARSKDDVIQIDNDQKQGGIKSSELEKGSQKIASDNSMQEKGLNLTLNDDSEKEFDKFVQAGVKISQEKTPELNNEVQVSNANILELGEVQAYVSAVNSTGVYSDRPEDIGEKDNVDKDANVIHEGVEKKSDKFDQKKLETQRPDDESAEERALSQDSRNYIIPACTENAHNNAQKQDADLVEMHSNIPKSISEKELERDDNVEHGQRIKLQEEIKHGVEENVIVSSGQSELDSLSEENGMKDAEPKLALNTNEAEEKQQDSIVTLASYTDANKGGSENLNHEKADSFDMRENQREDVPDNSGVISQDPEHMSEISSTDIHSGVSEDMIQKNEEKDASEVWEDASDVPFDMRENQREGVSDNPGVVSEDQEHMSATNSTEHSSVLEDMSGKNDTQELTGTEDKKSIVDEIVKNTLQNDAGMGVKDDKGCNMPKPASLQNAKEYMQEKVSEIALDLNNNDFKLETGEERQDCKVTDNLVEEKCTTRKRTFKLRESGEDIKRRKKNLKDNGMMECDDELHFVSEWAQRIRNPDPDQSLGGNKTRG